MRRATASTRWKLPARSNSRGGKASGSGRSRRWLGPGDATSSRALSLSDATAAPASTHSLQAAHVSAQVMIGGRLVGVDFVIDSGADYSVLGPEDALDVFGPAYLSLDFADPDTSLELSGVGGGVTRLLLRELPLAFFADDGSRVAVTLIPRDRRAESPRSIRPRQLAPAEPARPRHPPPLRPTAQLSPANGGADRTHHDVSRSTRPQLRRTWAAAAQISRSEIDISSGSMPAWNPFSETRELPGSP